MLTHHKDLGRLVTRGLRFGGVHVFEELLENPEQREVVLGAEELRYEPATFAQKFCRQLHSTQRQLSCRAKH